MGIVTHFAPPPIPTRNMDWSAVTDDYDADCDQHGYFSRDPIGYGATEREAVADLQEQLEAADEREAFLAGHCEHGTPPNEFCEDCEAVVRSAGSQPGSRCNPGCGYCGRCT